MDPGLDFSSLLGLAEHVSKVREESLNVFILAGTASCRRVGARFRAYTPPLRPILTKTIHKMLLHDCGN